MCVSKFEYEWVRVWMSGEWEQTKMYNDQESRTESEVNKKIRQEGNGGEREEMREREREREWVSECVCVCAHRKKKWEKEERRKERERKNAIKNR